MANQIARQMTADPNLDAVAATATHLSKFWEHDMRADLARAIDGGTVTVDDTVVSAMQRLAVPA
ncbi:MAG: formate dehydrogenase subunit delta [Acidimicrobiaceae bacterium]|nr:formate dehydrogenase subunit delta [Acidimicrobiaceae bacterium]